MPQQKIDKNPINRNHLIIFGFIVLSFVLDFLDKIEIFHNVGFFKFNKTIKLLFLVYGLFFIGTHLRQVFGQLKINMLTLFVISLIFLLKSNFTDRYLIEFARYFFTLSIFPILYDTYSKNQVVFRKEFYKLFKYFVIINTILVVVGIVFDLKIFETYKYDRLGYNGMILSQGMTPYIYACCMLVFWEFGNRKLIVLTLLLSLMSGVKSAFLAQFILLGLLMLYSTRFTRKIKIRALVVATLAFLLSLFVLANLPTFKEIIAKEGWLTAISSYRFDNTLELLSQMSTDNYNLLIGVTTLETVRLELQFVDIILFFGSIGVAVYLLWYYFYYNKVVKTNNAKAFFISIITIAIVSGNFLYIPLSFILVTIVLLLSNRNIKIAPQSI